MKKKYLEIISLSFYSTTVQRPAKYPPHFFNPLLSIYFAMNFANLSSHPLHFNTIFRKFSERNI